MLSRLAIGTTLRTYRIAEVIGSGQAAAGRQDTAAYLANDVSTHEELLLWQSPTIFKLTAKPRGVRDYFQQDGFHYLVLTLEGQNLSFLLTMAGSLDQGLAKLWMSQICQAIGYWHNRESLPPLVCLSQGPLTLAPFQMTGSDQVAIPSLGGLSPDLNLVLETDRLRFVAPEAESGDLTRQSDVYALGSMLYCLLTGQLAPTPEDLASRKDKLLAPSKLNPSVSSKMDKVVLKAMHKNPRKRHPTATQLAADLGELFDDVPAQETESTRKVPLLDKGVPAGLSNQPFFLASRPVLCYNLDSAVLSSWRTRNARLRAAAGRHSIGACCRHLVVYIG